MTASVPNKSVKVAIVGMTGSGKTVLISTLAMRMAQMSLENIFMAPFGDNRRQTLRYTQSNWITLNKGLWPPSTPAGELVHLQWELTTPNHQAQVQFLDCAGQDIRSLFRTDSFNPDNLTGDLKRVYENISSANILIFLVNMKDLLATPDYLEELMDLDQMFHTLNQRNDIPRKMAIVFSQYDKYKSEVDQQFNGDFLEYLRHYIPLLHGQYIRKRNFEIIPVAAVNDTQGVIENGEVKQYPVPNFSSYNLETLIHWIADSVEELAPEVQNAPSYSVNYTAQTTSVPQPEQQASPKPKKKKKNVPPVYTTPTPHNLSNAGPVPHPEQLSRPTPKYTPGHFITPMLIIFLCSIPTLLTIFTDIVTGNLYPIFSESFRNFLALFRDIFLIVLLYRSVDIIQDGHSFISPNSIFILAILPLQILFDVRHPAAFLVVDIILFVFLFDIGIYLNEYVKRHALNVPIRISPSTTLSYGFLLAVIDISYFQSFEHFPLYLKVLILVSKIGFLFILYTIMQTARDIQAKKMQYLK